MRELRRMTKHAEVDFVYPFDIIDIFDENLKMISSKILSRFVRTEDGANLSYSRAVNISMIEKLKADIVYTHRARIPTNLGSIPLIWFHSVADPRMSKANGASDVDIEAQYQAQLFGYRHATLVQVTSDAEVARHAARFPELADPLLARPGSDRDLAPLPCRRFVKSTSMIKRCASCSLVDWRDEKDLILFWMRCAS